MAPHTRPNGDFGGCDAFPLVLSAAVLVLDSATGPIRPLPKPRLPLAPLSITSTSTVASRLSTSTERKNGAFQMVPAIVPDGASQRAAFERVTQDGVVSVHLDARQLAMLLAIFRSSTLKDANDSRLLEPPHPHPFSPAEPGEKGAGQTRQMASDGASQDAFSLVLSAAVLLIDPPVVATDPPVGATHLWQPATQARRRSVWSRSGKC